MLRRAPGTLEPPSAEQREQGVACVTAQDFRWQRGDIKSTSLLGNVADELLLSSATKEVLPVTQLDGEAVGQGPLRGKPGPVYARLYEAYQRAKIVQSI